ncbi:mitochondrial import inner membrane translocase subunit tim13 [Drosophila persimilis]|uniref:mitochondrial import inner membrane translocase subunit tim13 n=1 Tax=Drosophila persimilis TaxID=7234 RepID=UPI000F0959E8|nr:mitochondrial import inner membrane translocase subunit tim13 [Drosophila persimilis]
MTAELESESIHAKQATRSGHCKLEVWKLSSGTRIRIRKENIYWASMEPKQETLKKPDSGQLKHIRQQILLANVQELIKKMTHRCFRICIVRPGPTLTTSERDCVSNCADLFMKSVQRVSQQYFRRRQWQQQRRLANATAPAASSSLSDNKKV